MLKIGNITFRNPLVLAPMADITSISFRLLCKRYGAALVITEMVNANAIERNNKATLKMARVVEEERPVAIQIFGQSNECIVKSCQILEKDADIIDFNCGCPVERVMRIGAGVALLKRPTKLKSIIEEASSTISKPFTVKIRSGLTRKSADAVKTAKLVESAGAAAITIHARTQDQGYSGKADWNDIKEVKRNVSIPVIGNGDVDSAIKCKQMLDETNCDFVMIGRAAKKSPYIFRQCLNYLEKGELLPDQTHNEKMSDFMELLNNFKKYNDLDFEKIRRRAMDFTHGIAGSARSRNQLQSAKTIAEIIELLRQ